jgi:hypothetical protein
VAERYTAVLPAWEASSVLDLSGDDLGAPLVARWLSTVGNVPLPVYQAQQAVRAGYSRYGFEAAAITVMSLVKGALRPQRTRARHATLRFGHPYAVVAVAGVQRNAWAEDRGVWTGVPVFSAWISEPSEADAPASAYDQALFDHLTDAADVAPARPRWWQRILRKH